MDTINQISPTQFSSFSQSVALNLLLYLLAIAFFPFTKFMGVLRLHSISTFHIGSRVQTLSVK